MSDVFVRDKAFVSALDAAGLVSAEALFTLATDPHATSVVTELDIAIASRTKTCPWLIAPNLARH